MDDTTRNRLKTISHILEQILTLLGGKISGKNNDLKQGETIITILNKGE